MSRVLPNALVAQAFDKLGVRNERLEADLPPMVELGLQKLYGFQHNDGGWGWWFDDTSHPYQTAYVLFGLAATRDAGFAVDEGVIGRGADWLRGQLDGMDVRTRAYSLYALAVAGYGEITPTRTLADDATLDPFSRAALAVALTHLGDEERARALVAELAAEAVVTEDEAYWPTGLEDGVYRQKTMASTTRTTAMALDGLARVDPQNPLVPKVVRWLMRQRQGASWGTTQETAFALLALSDYVVASRESAADYTYEVHLNGELLHSGPLSSGQAVITIPTASLRPGRNRVRILKRGEGPLYYTLLSRMYVARERIKAAGAISVTREYLDPTTGRPISSVTRGDLVQVRLTVEAPEEMWYVIVEDPLPAGFEGLNERLATTSFVAGEGEGRHWREYGYNRKDVLDDRVVFFNTQLERGRHVYTYLARATHDGDFHVLPVQVYLMYAPEVWGRSESDALTVK
ncbi:MAG: hypothetical protein ACE5OS_02575 [Anaerolineae bacterium]